MDQRALPRLTVWYYTKCPVCEGEINRQRDRLIRAARQGAIEFRDVNLEPDVLQDHGIGVEKIRKRLHGRDANGLLFTGGDCAREIWLRTPGDRWLAALSGLPLLRSAARIAYDGFAAVLYRHNRRKHHW